MSRLGLIYLASIGSMACSENQVLPMDTGDPKPTDSATVDEAPSAPGVRISPDSPTAENDLRCQRAQPSVDPEGQDLSYHISWERNGQPTSHQTELISSQQTEAGDSWTCIMVANDGRQDSPPGTDSVQILEQNQPPSAPTIQISPQSPGSNHPLSCQKDCTRTVVVPRSKITITKRFVLL